MVNNRYEQLKKAELGALISIVAYILVSAMKLVVGNLANSEALRADGLNNFTDILASVAVLIGLRIAQNQRMRIIAMDTGKQKMSLV